MRDLNLKYDTLWFVHFQPFLNFSHSPVLGGVTPGVHGNPINKEFKIIMF